MQRSISNPHSRQGWLPKITPVLAYQLISNFVEDSSKLLSTVSYAGIVTVRGVAKFIPLSIRKVDHHIS